MLVRVNFIDPNNLSYKYTWEGCTYTRAYTSTEGAIYIILIDSCLKCKVASIREFATYGASYNSSAYLLLLAYISTWSAIRAAHASGVVNDKYQPRNVQAHIIGYNSTNF